VSWRLSARIAVAGILSVTLAVDLGVHIALGLGQSAGLLSGDYSSHNHQGLVPLALAGLTVTLSAIFLYAVHLADVGPSSLPSLARELGRRIGWQSVALTSLAACLVLAGIETGEQLAAGRFDGLFSAFGSSPIVGLGLILLFSAIGNALLQAVCKWLAGAHARIVLAIAYLLSPRAVSPNRCCSRSKRVAFTVFRYACDIPQALGKRGPPILVR
jgi:hypothetical protein